MQKEFILGKIKEKNKEQNTNKRAIIFFSKRLSNIITAIGNPTVLTVKNTSNNPTTIEKPVGRMVVSATVILPIQTESNAKPVENTNNMIYNTVVIVFFIFNTSLKKQRRI